MSNNRVKTIKVEKFVTTDGKEFDSEFAALSHLEKKDKEECDNNIKEELNEIFWSLGDDIQNKFHYEIDKFFTKFDEIIEKYPWIMLMGVHFGEVISVFHKHRNKPDIKTKMKRK